MKRPACQTVTTETTTDEGTVTTTEVLYYAYDAGGNPLSVTLTDATGAESTYYYAVTVQGDVAAILTTSGTAVVEYTYDAWGNPLAVTGTLSDTLGETNSLRYRGYVYDSETDYYYLQSRYYNPELGRFISADGYASTGQGLLGNNMFAYCGNNPVSRNDPTGELFGLACAIIATGAIVGGILGAFSAATTGGNILESAIERCLTGAVGAACGLLISNPIVAVGVATLGGAAIDFTTQITTQYVENKSVDLSKVDYGRVVKTGAQTGIGAAIPQFGNATSSATDAFATALIWSEASAVIVAADVAVTNIITATNSSSRKTSIRPRHVDILERAALIM